MGPLCQTVGGPGRRCQSICLASLPAGPERFHLSVMKLDLVHFLFLYHAALNFLSMHKHEETVRKTKALSGGREGIHKDVILFYESYQVQNTEKILNVGETSSAQKIKKQPSDSEWKKRWAIHRQNGSKVTSLQKHVQRPPSAFDRAERQKWARKHDSLTFPKDALKLTPEICAPSRPLGFKEKFNFRTSTQIE